MPPRSLRKRSLSILSLVLTSHRRHEVGADLVGEHDSHGLALPQPPGFDLEIDQPDADAEEEPGQKIVDANRERHDVIDFLRRRPAERRDVLFRDHRVVKLIILVIKLDDRPRQLRALFKAKAGGQRPGSHIAHHDLERNDLDLANQLLAHVDSTDKMRRHADVIEPLEDVFRDSVVENALAFDDLMLLGVERGRVILEILDEGAGLRALIEDLGFTFINASAAIHAVRPWLEEIHSRGLF